MNGENPRLEVKDFVPFRRRPHCGTTKIKGEGFSDQVLSIASILEEPLKAKVVVIGDASVGKTSALSVLQTSSFTAGYKATVGVDFFYMNFNVAGLPVDIVLWDTAGQEAFRALSGSYYRNTNAVLMFFSLSSRPTFDHILTTWISDVRHNVTPDPENVQIFLVGAKCDLLREVSKEEADGVAQMMGAEYWEISAKSDGASIRDTTRDSIRDMMDRLVVVLLETMALNEYKAAQARKASLPLRKPLPAMNKDKDKKCCM